MNDISCEYLNQFVIGYDSIDSILIYSANLQDHVHHVSLVLSRLCEFQLYLKAEKCTFHLPSVQFLGYNISSKGISMDNGKAVVSWPIPQSVKELQHFHGFANFYRCFFQNYSLVSAAPLTSLLRIKPKTLSWSPEASQAFQELKDTFLSAPIL